MLPRFQNSLWGKVRITNGERERKKKRQGNSTKQQIAIYGRCVRMCVCVGEERQRGIIEATNTSSFLEFVWIFLVSRQEEDTTSVDVNLWK